VVKMSRFDHVSLQFVSSFLFEQRIIAGHDARDVICFAFGYIGAKLSVQYGD
jgi:hypothetical protein